MTGERLEMKKIIEITVITIAASVVLIGNLCSEASANLTIPSGLIQREIRKIDPANMTTVKKVRYMLKQKQNLFLVDVRPKEQFQKVRIPGSLNFPLHGIKTKTFLKSRPIILIGKGFEYNRMEIEIKRLKKRGFKPRILHGGISGWYQAKGDIEGDLLEVSGYNKIKPLDFYLEKNFDKWLVLNISKKESKEVKKILPYALHVPVTKDPGSINKILSVLRSPGKKQKRYRSILVLSETGNGYPLIEKELLKAGVLNTFYMQGGVKHYRQFLRHLALSQRPKSKRTKTVGDCDVCPKQEDEE